LLQPLQQSVHNWTLKTYGINWVNWERR